MSRLFKYIQSSFYTLLDISGILLGIILMAMGWILKTGQPIPAWAGWMLFALGVAAFLIHFVHFIVANKRGDTSYFYTTVGKPENT